ncbi:MAG: hypothetical protein ABH812_01480 [bacterium]
MKAKSSLYLTLFLCFSVFFTLSPTVSSSEMFENSLKMSVFIGTGSFSLFGYAPSNSSVTLSGIGILSETFADKNGYFEFKDQLSPIIPGYETCLSAKDNLGRTTNPVCIPPIPVNKYTEIGPILLPPTISLNKTDHFTGDDITFSGQSVPNSEVNLSMFVDKRITLIPVSHAYSIPEIIAQTDDKGNYAITLSSTRNENYRVFSQLKKDQDFSANSNTLRIKVYPYWMFILIFLKYLFSVFKNNLLGIIIISQIIAVAIFLTRWYLKPHKIMAQRAIILRRAYPRTIREVIRR